MFGPSPFERVFKKINNFVANPLSLMLNALLFLVVLRFTSTHIRPYKKVLISSVAADVVAVTILLFTQLTIYVDDGFYYSVSEGLLPRLEGPWISVVTAVSAFGYQVHIAAVPPQYIYRFFLICRHKELTVTQFCCVFGSFLWFPFLYGSIWLSKFSKHEYLVPLLSDKFRTTEWMDVGGDVPAFAVCPIDDMTIICVAALLFLVCCYGTIIITSIFIHKHLKRSQKSLSLKTKNMQRQMTRILLIQAIVPFLSLGLPIIVDVLAISTGFSVPAAGIVFMVLTAWAPVCNPLMIFFLVPLYRRPLLESIRKKLRLSSSSTAVESISIPINNLDVSQSKLV